MAADVPVHEFLSAGYRIAGNLLRGERESVEAAPSLVTLQHGIVTDVEAEAARVDHQLGESGDVVCRG